jgi:hypothetical protein
MLMLVSVRCSGRAKLGVSGGSGAGLGLHLARTGVVGRNSGAGAGGSPSGDAMSGLKEESSGNCVLRLLAFSDLVSRDFMIGAGSLSIKAASRITHRLSPATPLTGR